MALNVDDLGPAQIANELSDGRLRINWIEARPGLSGGVKSNRLIAEAMARRGHDVRIAFLAGPEPWPKPWQWNRFRKRIRREFAVRGKQRHHLEKSEVPLIPVYKNQIDADDVPDADLSIATFWPTREWIENWPKSKGAHGYFVRHHELHAGDPDRVASTYQMPGIKFVISTWLQRLMADQYGDRSTILVPNGVDWQQFDSPPREKALRPTVGVMYGRQKWKGAKVAFAALKTVAKRISNLRMLAFGSAPLNPSDEPPENLEYYLRPEQHEIPGFYRSADVWLVPSVSEGFGMPGLEAAACRCPIVSTRCGGPEDYVRNGESGFLVPVGDDQAMANAISKVLDLSLPDWNNMSETSYKIASRFDWNESAGKMEHGLLNRNEFADHP